MFRRKVSSSCRIDLRDDIQQFTPRIGQIGVLRFQKTIALLEFIVFLDGVEIHRTHVVELAGKIGDEFLLIFFCSRGREPRLLFVA